MLWKKGRVSSTQAPPATYGDGSLGFSDAAGLLPGLRPLNMYGYSKHLFDLWLLREHLQSEVASLKFFNVYGPNEYHKGAMQSVVAKAHRQIRTEGRLCLFKADVPGLADGEQKRDFVYVKDCAVFVAWLLDRRDICGIRNVGTARPAASTTWGGPYSRALAGPAGWNMWKCPQA